MNRNQTGEYFKKENDMQTYSPEEARDMILAGTAPDNMIVKGNLNLRGSKKLTKLPDGLEVLGDFHLHECTSLTQLPNGLIVHGNFDLWDCTSLKHLSDGLSVGGILDLENYTSLKALPAKLNVGDCIYLDHPLEIPDTVECKSFIFRGVEDFPREYINDPSLVTPEMIEAEEDEDMKAALIYLAKF
jgi:hypothetical protein